MPVAPRFLDVLAVLGVAFGLAALPIFRRPNPARTPPFGRLVPHPSEPSNMLSFAAFSSFLILIRLALFLPLPVYDDPVNDPRSSSRWSDAPADVDVQLVDVDGRDPRRFTYPRNTADLAVAAARRFETDRREDRIRAVRDLAWWTAVCPNYRSFTLPRLARALRDPDPGVKGAAAIALGSTGGNGAAAVPDLLAARGTTIRYFDYLVDEAVLLIRQSPTWPPAKECEAVPREELESRAAQHGLALHAILAPGT